MGRGILENGERKKDGAYHAGRKAFLRGGSREKNVHPPYKSALNPNVGGSAREDI